MTQSHYLNQLIKGVLWHSFESNFTRSAHNSICSMCLVIILLKLKPHLPGANVLMSPSHKADATPWQMHCSYQISLIIRLLSEITIFSHPVLSMTTVTICKWADETVGMTYQVPELRVDVGVWSFLVQLPHCTHVIRHHIVSQMLPQDIELSYRKVSNIRHTKCQNLNDSRLLLQLSVPSPRKPSVKSIMKM